MKKSTKIISSLIAAAFLILASASAACAADGTVTLIAVGDNLIHKAV